MTNVDFLSKWHLAVEQGEHTLAALNASIQKEPLPTRPCPEDAPMWDGKKCISCPEGNLYLIKDNSCYKAKAVTNVKALNSSGLFIPSEKITLASLNASIHKDRLPVAPCPEKTPVFNNSKCVTCPHGDYLVLENNTCYTPKKVANVAELSEDKDKKVIEDDNHTLEDLKDSIDDSSLPVETCPEDKPVAGENGTECKAIPEGKLLLLKDGTFYTPEKASNIPEVTKKNSFLEGENSTLDGLKDSLANSSMPVDTCPADKPYAVNGSECVSCDESKPYFDLEKEECVACPENLFYDSANHKCVKEINITNVDGLLSFIETGNYTRDNVKKQLEELASTRKTTVCPLKTPMASADGSSCTSC